ncbi:segregation and condensation protein A [Spiribacter salinus]|uniref:segregation and condensation protein A n=1 Tax=Spiribacter salinus TaxID=1335746 RepID=UPI001C94AC0F|nr:ScpA family protein [Spiribacter salinus]MBY5267980.1 segregation and condensation protein A [Spiribacter salinus]
MTETDAPDLLDTEVTVRVRGEPYGELPRDLYIPPDALEVFLEAFEGPLDLLLYLIRRQNLEILDIPIAEITRQYMGYVDLMKDLRLELAAEYLVMAAMLAEIKSRMLLPRPPAGDDDEALDPRAELVRRLQAYEQFKEAGRQVDHLPRVARDVFPASAATPPMEEATRAPQVDLAELLAAFAEVLSRAEMFNHHQIRREALSVRERMSETLTRLSREHFVSLDELLRPDEGRAGVVVTFLAVLELLKAALVELVQAEPFAPLYLRGGELMAEGEGGE